MTKIKGRTEIAQLGEFGLIDHLTEPFKAERKSTIKGVGDDAAVIAASEESSIVVSTDTMVEGIDFDLRYFPPKHLGYKAVTKGISDVLAMNAIPEQITVSIAVSSKISVEFLQDLYDGIKFACHEAEVDMVGGDTSASINGLVINITAIGRAKNEAIVYRSGAKVNDLICITGSLGAPYMGLKLLQRESRVLEGVVGEKPQFEGYEYLLERYLKPRARYDIIRSMAEENIVPTAMIDLSDGLSSDLMQICRSSLCGARIYLERMPIARQCNALGEEMHIDPVTAALNGGEDYELLFTLPLSQRDKIASLGCIDIIGHITEPNTGCFLVTPDGGQIELRAQGFVKQA
ncbi:MAG: thiamine-phosphate kinase [Alistipes sp.]|nr:thiamine-phosphate kinase [Alistipes sp.]